jgi:hypothetical protein
MRKLFILIGVLLWAAASRAQMNHVPNGSFEQYTTCPFGTAEIDKAVGWYKYTNTSPDFFHPCAGAPANVPANLFGFQTALHGVAYGGIHTDGPSGAYREFMRTAIAPLVPGRAYDVSMWVSQSDFSTYACSGLSVYFFHNGPLTINTTTRPALTPQINYTSYGQITDRTNWVQLIKTFVADSAYDNMVIGFFTPGMQLINTPVSGGSPWAYYYIDSVEVKEFGTINIGAFNRVLCRGDVIQVPYQLSTNAIYYPGNVFTLQLSDATGSFAAPVNIGSLTSSNNGIITGTLPMSLTASNAYQLRIVSSNPADTSYPVTLSIGNIVPDKPIATSNAPLCTGQGNLNLMATTATPNVSWKWTGPAAFSSTVQNPNIPMPTVAMSGEYIVETSIYGCKSQKDTVVVSINESPGTVNVTSNSPVCSGGSVNLTATNSHAGVNWTWLGPNSFSAAISSPSLSNGTVAMSGTYTAMAEMNGCIRTASVNVVVNPTPVVTATGNSGICEGTPLNLLATSVEPSASYIWTGPVFFTANTAATGIINTMWYMSGNYTVTASLNGCSSQFTLPVNIKPMPVGFSATSNSPVCEGLPLNLIGNTSSTGVTFSWSGPSYSSTLQNPTIVNSSPSMSSDYELVATLNGCVLKDTVTVEVRPTPSVTASSNFNICEGMPINMLASSNEPAATFSWTGPLGFTANTAIAVRNNSTVPMSGNYLVTVALNGCSSQFSMPVTVHPMPVVPTVSSNSTACDTLKLFASGSVGAGYIWNGPLGFSSTQQNPYIQPASPANNGTYTVFSTLGPCVSAGVNIQATVHPSPYLGAYASPNETICDGTVVTFVTVPMNGIQNPQFQWFKNGVAVPGQTSLTYIGAYATGDKFYSRTYAQDLCNTNITLYSNEINMVVIPIVNNLAATITSTPAIPQPGQAVDFMCTVVSGGYTPQYQWRKNGVDVNGAISANWSANNLAPYDEITCHVTSSDPCAAPTQTLSNKVIINFPTVVADVNADNGISIYPNPNSGNFTIEGKKHIEQVEVLNSVGQKVHTVKVGSNRINISLPATLANGVYTLSISTEDGMTQQRITLQR